MSLIEEVALAFAISIFFWGSLYMAATYGFKHYTRNKYDYDYRR